MHEIRLDGRVAIVTGAGTGLGRARSLALAGRGRTACWRRDPTAPGGPEDIAEHLDEIRDMTHFVVPMTAQEDLDDLFG